MTERQRPPNLGKRIKDLHERIERLGAPAEAETPPPEQQVSAPAAEDRKNPAGLVEHVPHSPDFEGYEPFEEQEARDEIRRMHSAAPVEDPRAAREDWAGFKKGQIWKALPGEKNPGDRFFRVGEDGKLPHNKVTKAATEFVERTKERTKAGIKHFRESRRETKEAKQLARIIAAREKIREQETRQLGLDKFWQRNTFRGTYFAAMIPLLVGLEEASGHIVKLLANAPYAVQLAAIWFLTLGATVTSVTSKVVHNITKRRGRYRSLTALTISAGIAGTLTTLEAYLQLKHGMSLWDAIQMASTVPTPHPPKGPVDSPVGLPLETPSGSEVVELRPERQPLESDSGGQGHLPYDTGPSRPLISAETVQPFSVDEASALRTGGMTAFTRDYLAVALADMQFPADQLGRLALALNDTLIQYGWVEDFFQNTKEKYFNAQGVLFRPRDIINTPLLGQADFLRDLAQVIRDKYPSLQTALGEGSVERLQDIMRRRFAQ